MQMLKIMGPLVFGLAIVACESTPDIRSDKDPNADFTQFSTFAWVDGDPMIAHSDHAISPLMEERVNKALKSELESKGFQFVENEKNADLAVSYTIGARDKIEFDQFAPRYYGGYNNLDYRWGHGFYSYANVGPLYRDDKLVSHEYVEGSLAVDMFDAKTAKPVWHVLGTKRLSKKDLELNGKNAGALITQLLSDFPPEN